MPVKDFGISIASIPCKRGYRQTHRHSPFSILGTPNLASQALPVSLGDKGQRRVGDGQWM